MKARGTDPIRTALLIGGALVVGGFTVYQLSHTGANPTGVTTCTPSAVENGDCANTDPGAGREVGCLASELLVGPTLGALPSRPLALPQRKTLSPPCRTANSPMPG